MTRVLSALPRVVTILAITALAVATVDGRVVRRQTTGDTCVALDTFQRQVEAYAVLHRRLAASLPPLASRLDGHSWTIARTYLASAIRAARSTARQGDFFTPDVTRFFRVVIEEASSPSDVVMFAPLMDEDGRLLPGTHPAIHTPFPAWETRELPSALLFMLPTLPPELEYRIVDYDLVLWDVTADLIVDVLPYALAHPASDAMYR